jgi:predicted nucleic acid-binding protein
MSVANFFDSNILIYLFDDSAPAKQEISRQLIREALLEGTGCISFQVVQETLNVVTRKFAQPLSLAQADTLLDTLLVPLMQVMPSMDLYKNTLKIQSRRQFSFYDSLIIAAAQHAQCQTLYSEDLQHGQRIGTLTIKNPYRDL